MRSLSTHALTRVAGFALCFGLMACTSFEPASPELLAKIATHTQPVGDFFDTGTATLRSERWNGEFTAAIAWRSASVPLGRLQLFNDVGTKALDMILGDGGVAIRTAGAEETERASLEDADPGYSPALFFGLTLAGELRPLDATNVLGAARRGDGWLLDLEPFHPSHVFRAECDADGRVLAFVHDYGWASWRFERSATQRRLVASGFELEIDIGTPEPADEPHDEAIFGWRARQ